MQFLLQHQSGEHKAMSQFKIFDEMTAAYEKFKADDERPAENNFDYFGEGYLAARRESESQVSALSTRIREIEGQVAAIHSELHNCADTMVDWAGYASPYMQEKHGLSGDVCRVTRALDDTATIAATHDARVRNLAIEECKRACESVTNDCASMADDAHYHQAYETEQLYRDSASGARQCVIALMALKTAASKSEVEK